jgi:hypothetical protein
MCDLIVAVLHTLYELQKDDAPVVSSSYFTWLELHYE